MKYVTPVVYQAAYERGDWQPFYDARERYETDLVHADLPARVKELAGSSLVDDALIARVMWQTSEDFLVIVLRCGDWHDGYFDLIFRYAGVALSEADGIALEQISKRAQTSVWYGSDCFVQEIERLSDRRIEHRLLFHGRGSASSCVAIAVACRELQIRRAARKSRRLPPIAIRFVKSD